VNPNNAIWQGLLVGLSLAAILAFGWNYEAESMLAGAVLFSLPLVFLGVLSYRVPDGSNGPTPIGKNEYAKIVAGLVAIALPVLVVGLKTGGDGFIGSSESQRGVLLAMLLIAAAVAFLIFLSTLIDWAYVRPRLRGNYGAICATSMWEQWRLVTQVWIVHRSLVTLAGIGGVTALAALGANAWVKPIDETVAGSIAAVATIIVGFYLTRVAPMLALAMNPPLQVGDVVEMAEEFRVHQPGRLREYFVVDVAREGVKLLQVGEGDRVPREGPDSDRTHDRMVDVLEVAKLLRGRRPMSPCSEKCQVLTRECRCPRMWVRPATRNKATASDLESAEAA
jgi:hypothetical protein